MILQKRLVVLIKTVKVCDGGEGRFSRTGNPRNMRVSERRDRPWWKSLVTVQCGPYHSTSGPEKREGAARAMQTAIGLGGHYGG